MGLASNQLIGFGAASAGVAGHRYWRVHITAGATSQQSLLGQIELMIGGVDQIPTMTAATTSGVTMSADSEESGSTPAWEAGGDSPSASQYWASTNSAKPHWIKVDFGSGNAKDITSYSVRCWQPFNQYYPTDFTLDWSDDNSNWTTVNTQTGQSFTADERKAYTI